jgi:MFS family permease
MLNNFRGLPSNVWRMGVAQALMMTMMNVNIINTGLAGGLLAPLPWLATLPLSLQFVATMLATLPASLVMARLGRRPVFIFGVLLAASSAFVQAFSIVIGSFPLFMMAGITLGVGQGIAQFYRYAAADSVAGPDKPRALSLVLVGGLVAAFIGPEIAYRTSGLIDGALYAGCFLSAGIVQLGALVVLAGFSLPKPEKSATSGRSLAEFIQMPGFVAAVTAAAMGYATMSFLMTATPLQIVNISQLGNEANARVIQWHVIAMFLPSLFTGSLIVRFGVYKILWSGVLLYVATILAALAGTGFWHYWLALVLLGLGWNFLFIGGSSMIAGFAEPHERGRIQGVADFAIFSCVASASLLAGILHSQLGWVVLVMTGIVPVLLISLSLLQARQAAKD